MMKNLLQVIHFLLNNKAIIDRYDLREKADTSKQENSRAAFGMAKLFSSLILIVVLQSIAWGQTTMAHFGLNGNLNVDNDNVVGTPTATNNGLSTSINNLCEGSGHLYSNSASDFLDININATGFNSISISWQQNYFDSGSSRWDLYGDYNNDGTNDFTKTDNTLVTSSCATVAVLLPNEFSDRSNVRLRIKSNTTNRIYLDDITITGTFNPTSPFPFTSSGTFTVPDGVTQLTVECWGGGGAGGARTSGNNVALAGGGGGAYSRSLLTVTPGNTYTVNVGNGSTSTADGGDSWFGSTSTILAKGGGSVADNSNSPGSGGLAIAGTGTTKLDGGNGATGTGGNFGGGGGSSAGTASVGNFSNTSTNQRIGATAPNEGGNGGTGASSGTGGTSGISPGGGGGGGYRAGNGTTQDSGNGADGQVIITWSSCPIYSITSTTATPVICAGGSSLISLSNTTASNLPVGNYIVTYNLSSPNGATGLTANMTVTTAGNGSFATSSLPNIGTTLVTITNLAVGSCSSSVSSNNTANILVAGTGTWLGTVGTDWNTASNWCGGIPTATTNVTIPSAAVNQPIIGADGGHCRDINISSGASLTISGSNVLMVSGDWINNGTFVPNSSTVVYNGSSQIVGSGDYFNLTLSGSGTKNLQTGTASIGGNFTVDNVATTAVTGLTIGGDVILERNFSFTGGIFTHNVAGNWTKNGWGTFNSTGGTINFRGNSSTINGTHNDVQTFNNIIVSKTDGQTLSVGGSFTSLNVAGNFELSSGAFSQGNKPTVISGNWVNNGGSVTSGTGSITMKGVSRTIGGTSSTTFNNLTIGNTARISLTNNQTVNGVLTLANGMLNLGAYNLTLGVSSSISASSFYTTNMIVADGTGELRKIFIGAGSFMFPVGDNSDGAANYSPMTISFASGTFAGGAYAGVRVTDLKHPSNTSITNYLTRYWTISQSGITSFSSTITGNYEYGADITGQEYLQNAAEYTGSLPWITYSSLASNTLTASNVMAFGDFTGMEVPPISVSPGSLTGFNYNSGSGPSAQQQFIVSGVNLSANLVITPPADFEISSGSGFQSTPITLTQSGGVVNNTAIYARLKAGLSVGNYNSENIVVSSTGKTSQNVTLSGSVTSLSMGTAFWYKADGATPYGSNFWNDETVNNNDATRTGGTVSLANNTVNFNPSLSFSGVILGMQIANSASVQSFIIVNNPTTGSMVQAGGLIGATPDLGIRLNAAKNAWRENNNNNDWAYSNLSGAGGRINGVSGFGFSGWNIVNQNHGSANDSRYYIGGYYTGRSYTGSIAEIMAFTGAVPEQDRVETYLALKYGITLGSTSNAINYINPSGSVIWEGSNTYQNDVAGLGSDGAYGLNQKVSSSINVASGSARVVMATTNDFTAPNLSGSRTALANGQYLIWGHNNLAVGVLITDGGFDRVSRIWKVQNTGVSSNINLQIDLNGFPAPLSGLNLVLDNDANFDNGGTTIVPLTNSSGSLYAASVNFPAGTSYFTIGKCKSVSVTVNSPVICADSGGATITASPSPTGTYNYLWTVPGGATNPGNVNNFNATIQGPYNVEITNVGGCIASGSGNLTINPKPTITLSSNTSICEGSSIGLTATGGISYSWSPSTGLSSTTGSSVTANPSTSTTYTVIGTDGNGCTNTAQVSITITPSASIGLVSGTSPLCIGATTTYLANTVVLGGGTGAWSSNDTNIATVNSSTGVVTGVAAGTCNIIYTISNGCGGTTFKQQAITITPNPSIGSVSGTSPLCIGSTTTYMANSVVLGGGTGAWSSSNASIATVNSSTGLVTAVAAGTCNIIYTIIGGCGITQAAQQALTVVAPVGDPAAFGDNIWNVYAYQGSNIGLNGITYKGYYTESMVSFSTIDRWGINGSPDEATGFQGCQVTDDNHTFVYKRKGFPSGTYRITIGHDDSYQLYIDDVLAGSSDAWDNRTPVVLTNFYTLRETTKIEFRVAENGGESRGALTFAPQCLSPTDGGTIAGTQTICSGDDPSVFTSQATASGQTGTLEYKWQSSITGNSSGFSDISGATGLTYDIPSGLTQTTWYKRLARVTCAADWSGAVESNIVEVSVNPLPTAGISLNNSPICSEDDAIFSLTGTNGATVTYNINGGSNTTATLIGGTATVTISGATGNQRLNLVSVTNGTCSQSLSGNSSVTVNPKPSVGSFN